jgi:predicted RNase H-like nuclease
MVQVAGVDGTPGGWAVMIVKDRLSKITKADTLSDLLKIAPDLSVIAIDVPIGLLDTYEVGGRSCDRVARNLLGPRASSVFPAPVRPVLAARSWPDACAKSRASAPKGKAVSKQTYAILPKIKEIDELLQTRHELRDVVREVHPEVSFCELVGAPMVHRKGTAAGRDERRVALKRVFSELNLTEEQGREERIAVEDIFDAAIACWSALRLANGKARSLPARVPFDATGLPMAIWV